MTKLTNQQLVDIMNGVDYDNMIEYRYPGNSKAIVMFNIGHNPLVLHYNIFEHKVICITREPLRYYTELARILDYDLVYESSFHLYLDDRFNLTNNIIEKNPKQFYYKDYWDC
jgi:hypothetical protein